MPTRSIPDGAYMKAPHYAGYNRLHQRESVTVWPNPQHKYQNVSLNHRSLASDSNYQSMYMQEQGVTSRAVVAPDAQPARTHGFARSIVLPEKQREATPTRVNVWPERTLAYTQQKPMSAVERDTGVKQQINPRFTESDTIREEGKTHRPTNWATSYQTDFDGWKTDAVMRHIGPDTLGKKSEPRELESAKHQSYRHTFKYNQIRKSRPQTTYGRDFGETGHVPGQRLSGTRDLVGAVSANATSRELFRGTTKGINATRIPGYSGFIPASTNNDHQVQGSLFPVLKDNLRETYRHDMPGYCGHKPAAMVNDSGPRDPHSLKPHDANRYQISLLLDSMVAGKEFHNLHTTIPKGKIH